MLQKRAYAGAGFGLHTNDVFVVFVMAVGIDAFDVDYEIGGLADGHVAHGAASAVDAGEGEGGEEEEGAEGREVHDAGFVECPGVYGMCLG